MLFRSANGKLLGSFERLSQQMQQKKQQLVAVMSGGNFDKNFQPEGLYVEKSVFLKSLNQKTGQGNFYLPPNGVFYSTKNYFNIVKSSDFNLQESVEFAQQAGPMLLENGQINPNFGTTSTNFQVRNAIVLFDAETIGFVISDDKVSFHELASFCQQIGAKQALCLDSGDRKSVV